MGEGRPAERPDQDPGDRRGPRGHHRDPGRGHQRQRDPDLLPGALPRGHQRLPGRPGAGQGRRHRPVDDPLGRVVLRLPRRHRDRQAPDAIGTDEALALKSKAGIANARLAYQVYEEEFATERRALLAAGANRQRPLWASTGVKDPAYPTPSTSPSSSRPASSTPCRRRPSRPRSTTASSPATPSPAPTPTPTRCSTRWPRVGVSYNDVIALLENEGVEKFVVSWNELLEHASRGADGGQPR